MPCETRPASSCSAGEVARVHLAHAAFYAQLFPRSVAAVDRQCSGLDWRQGVRNNERTVSVHTALLSCFAVVRQRARDGRGLRADRTRKYIIHFPKRAVMTCSGRSPLGSSEAPFAHKPIPRAFRSLWRCFGKMFDHCRGEGLRHVVSDSDLARTPTQLEDLCEASEPNLRLWARRGSAPGVRGEVGMAGCRESGAAVEGDAREAPCGGIDSCPPRA